MEEFVAIVQEKRNGPFRTRSLVGKSMGEITARLLDSGMAVAHVSQQNVAHPLAKGRISIKDIVFFLEQVETTLFLGMEPRTALKACAITISQKSKSGRNLQRVVAAMQRMVAGGESLASVAKRFPNLFSSVAVGLLEAGERSGSLNESFRSMRILAARAECLRHQVGMILLQPIITLLMAAATVGIMVGYIVPQFRSMLDYLGGKLPWQTQIMISMTDSVTSHRLFVLGLLSGILYALVQLPDFVKRNPWTHGIVIKLPVIGWYLLDGIRTNFIAAFAQLKKNKLTNPMTLMLLKDISWFFPYRTAIARAHMGLKSGASLASVLAAEADIIGERNIQYFRFIEETGSDVEQLERLATVLNRDLDAQAERLKTIFNPLILIMLAIIIGMIASAIILPMYEIYNHI
jgi:type IV pilus assembly protein PilC